MTNNFPCEGCIQFSSPWNQLPAISFHRQIPKKDAVLSMTGDEELRAVVADIRLIAADCFDLRAVERLRLLVEQIEKSMLGARVVLTMQDKNQGGGFNSV